MKKPLLATIIALTTLTLPTHGIYWWFTGTSVTDEHAEYNESLEKNTPIYAKNYYGSSSRLFDGGLAYCYTTLRKNEPITFAYITLNDGSGVADTTNYRIPIYYQHEFFDPQNPPRDHAEVRDEAIQTDEYKAFLARIDKAQQNYDLALATLTEARTIYQEIDAQYQQFEASRPPQVTRNQIKASLESGEIPNDRYLLLADQIAQLERSFEAKELEIQDAEANLTQIRQERENRSLYFRALEARNDIPPAYSEDSPAASSPRPMRPGEAGSSLDSEVFDNYDGVIAQLRSVLGEQPLNSTPSNDNAVESPPAYDNIVDAPPSYEDAAKAAIHDLDDFELAILKYLAELERERNAIDLDIKLAQRTLLNYIDDILEETNFKEPNPYQAQWNAQFAAKLNAENKENATSRALNNAKAEARHFISDYIEAQDRKHLLSMRLSMTNLVQPDTLPKNLDFYNFVVFGNAGLWSYRDWNNFYYAGSQSESTAFKFEVIDYQGNVIFEKNDIPLETQSFKWSRSGFGQTIEFEVMIDVKKALYPLKVESSGYLYNDWEDEDVLEVHADFIPIFQPEAN